MTARCHGVRLWLVNGGLAAAVLLAAGCGRDGPPAPVLFKGSAPGSVAPPPGPEAAPEIDPASLGAPAGVTVRPVAKPSPALATPAPKSDVAVAPLPEIGPEPPGDESQAASVPAPARPGAATPAAEAEPALVPAGTVTVERGDTLYALARRHRVSLRELIQINELDPPYLLLEGQRLTLPRPRGHEVAKGDTVYGISRRYSVDMSALVRANDITPPYTIKVGQVLRLPAATDSPQADSALADAAGTVDGAAPDAADPAASVETAAVRPDRRVPVPEPPPRAGPSFAWPVRGRIISTFGPKQDGLHNDGVNILVEKGAPVAAAENGVVAYAGNELRGFGNLILLKHAGGWMTAYAHNDRLLVKRGERVKRGQVIARAGNTGNVKTPQLHFEIRHGSRAVNPNQHLASAEGL